MLEFKMHEAKMLRNQGKKIKDIAEAIGRSERTVFNYLSEETKPRKKRMWPSKLDAYKQVIDNILDEDPDYNRIVLFERIGRMGYNGGISILRDYAARKAKEINIKAVIRFETEPGCQAQVDWKVLSKQYVDGKVQKLYAFTMVMGYSRYPFVLHTTSMEQATFLACHVKAFHHFGGVPKEILYDNMKTAFIYDFSISMWKPNKDLLALATHYGFKPRRCRVRRPETKGKVERFINYYVNNFWIRHKGKYHTLDYLNNEVLVWISTIKSFIIRDLSESRQERFDFESRYLTLLPPNDFDYCLPIQVKVSREALICFKTNWYSVPPKYIGKQLTLRVNPLNNTAQLSENEKIIRIFTVHKDKRNQREYRTCDRQALHALWKQQQLRVVRKRRKDPETEIRSPKHYESYFDVEGQVR